MIAAAHADGRLEGEERRAILERIAAMPLSPADRAELLAEIERPVDLSTLVAAATTPELATEVYTASRMGMDPDTPAERAYLSLLAARLGLPEALVNAVEGELSENRVAIGINREAALPAARDDQGVA